MQTFFLSAVCGHKGPRKRPENRPAGESGSIPEDKRELQLTDIMRDSAEDAAECARADLAHEFGHRT